MNRDTLTALVGVAMVALGLLQTALGVRGGDPVYAGLGLLYALLGVAWLAVEV